MRRTLNTFFALALVVGFLPLAVSAQPVAEPAAVEQALLDRLQREGAANFFVKMAVDADLSAAYQMSDWNARGAYVFGALQEVARVSQASVIQIAQQYGLDYTSFLTTNSVFIRGGTLEAALDLAALPGVAYLRAEQLLEIPDAEPGPTIISGIEAGQQAAVLDWGILDTHADQVWSQFGVKGAGITVGSIDTGVDYTHIALQPNYVCGAGPHANCWFDPGAADCQGAGGGPCEASPTGGYHGTHTLGTVVAVDDPTFPYIVGMAPAARWIACLGCPLGPASCPEFDTNACADWMLAPGGDPANRPQVVTNSWGRGNNDLWFQPAVNAWRAAGIFPAFSAGNSGSNCSTLASPADYEESFSTAAHDSSRVIAGFSSRGPSLFGHEPYTKPNLSAPGVSIISTRPGNGWEALSGTSTASPHTAGAVALVWSACPGYLGQVDLTTALLQNTANTPPAGDCGAPPDGEGNYTYGYGYLDVYAAVQRCVSAGPPGTMQGQAWDEFGNPVQDAAVVVTPQQGGVRRQTTTDASGFYSVQLEPGSHDLTISKVGYVANTISGVTVLTGQTTVQDVTLVSPSLWRRGTPASFSLTAFDGEYNPRDKLIYFLGGRTGATTHDKSIYTYDPATGVSADTGADMLYNASDVSVARVGDDGTGRGEALYVIGGRDVTAGTNLNVVQRYYPQQGLVEVVSSDPYPDTVQGFVVSAAGVEVVGDRIYVFGGWEETAAPYFSSSAWVFDPKGVAGSRWTNLGCTLSPGRSYINTAVAGGKVYAMGGVSQYVTDPVDRVPSDQAQLLDTSNLGACWQAIANLPVATVGGRGFGLGNGKVLVVGGGDWPGVSNAVYVYDVASNTWTDSFSPLAQARRDQAGVFIPDYTADPNDAFPSIWVFGGSLGGENPPFGNPEYYPVAPGVGTLEGHARDGDGNSVAGATVFAQRQGGGTGVQATTDASGYYSLVVLTGTYDMTASKAGYFSASASGVVVTANQTVVQDFTLAQMLIPDAAFSGTPTSGLVPLAVQFTDESTGTISSWLWNFGDGFASPLESPSHTYAAPGSYTVSLTVTGPNGSDTLTRSNYITVYRPVRAIFSGSPNSGVRPLPVSFTNSSTGDYTSSLWSFGDGTTSTETSPTHIYATKGTYSVSLTVSGPGGTNTLTRAGYIRVFEPVHAGFVGTPTSGVKPLTVAFTNNSTGDYTQSNWGFGDGTTSTETNPSHTYANPGVYKVTLTVSGPGGTETLALSNYITVLAGRAHVNSITLSSAVRSGTYTIKAKILIVDQSNQAVPGATAYITWTLPNNTTKSQQAQTNTSGLAQFSVQSTLVGTYKICVTNVAKSNWAYDPSQNSKTCETKVVP